jgi:hypothetical protein
MNRLKSAYAYLCGTNFAYLLILGLVVKALIHDVSYASFLLTLPILGFESYKLYIKTKTVDPVVLDGEIRKELDNIKAKLNANTLEKGLNSPTTPIKRYF